MRLNKLILTKNACSQSGTKIKVKGIMIHSTGVNNPRLKRYVGPNDGQLGHNPNNNHWNQPHPDGRQVCVHAFIGKLENGNIATYQTLPWDHRGWHCGGAGNNTHIGIEICEDNLYDRDYFDKVYNEAVEVSAMLCEMYSLDPMADGVLICHSEGHARGIASNHSDVMHWFIKHCRTMDSFRKAVKAKMRPAQLCRVKVTADELNIRKGPGTNYPIVGCIKDNGVFTIVEECSGWGRLKSGAGWISLKYTKKI